MQMRATILVGLILALAPAANAQTVIRLPSQPAPGAETADAEGKEYFSKTFNTQVVTNVSQPTLTQFSPSPESANGTAVIICPGGGFHILSINSEGVEVAKWLNAHGVTAFVLRYRLVPTGEDGVRDMLGKSREKVREDMRPAFTLALADGAAAVKYVRDHAAELGVSPKRVGIMGFSAGGSVTTGVMLKPEAETRPDFGAPIYAYLGVIDDLQVPKNPPPLFVLAATDDQLGLVGDSVTLYGKWLTGTKAADSTSTRKAGTGLA